jgi:hypothetical protein
MPTALESRLNDGEDAFEPVLSTQYTIFRQTAQGTYGASRPLPTGDSGAATLRHKTLFSIFVFTSAQ